MNAGAYGGETKHVVKSATVLTPAGEIKTLSNQELDFGYRHSAVQDDNLVVLAADFQLTPGDFDQIKAEMDDLNARRAPSNRWNCLHVGVSLSARRVTLLEKLIHDAGLQGYGGGAQVSTKHAGFIVNIGNGTATDYLAVIRHVQATVKAKFGVDLETEVGLSVAISLVWPGQ